MIAMSIFNSLLKRRDMNHLSLSALRPASRAKSAVAAAAAALAVAGCANYAGISSDKQIAAPENFEATQSVPGQGGQWPALD